MSRYTPEHLAAFAKRGMLATQQATKLCKQPEMVVKVSGHPALVRVPLGKVEPSIMSGLQLRPSGDVQKLNKTEAAFNVKLRADKWPWVGVQAMTFKLGDDCRYTPDFITVDEGTIVAWEVKGGFIRDDAMVKIKTAARMYPFIQFIMAQRKRASEPFVETDIKP